MSADPASEEGSAAPTATFGTWLAGLSDEALLALLSARPDVSVPPPADFDVLGRRLAAAASVSRALERVDRFGLELLETLVLFGGAAGGAELAGRTGLDVDVVERGFDRLRRLGLLWGEEPASLPRGVADEVGPHPLGFGRSAAHLLRTEFLPEERAVLATTLGLTPGRTQASNTANGQVSELVTLFDDPARVDGLIAGLGAPERAVLARLADGAPVGSTAAPVSVVPLDEATTAVARLLAQGLLMPAGGDLVELPREVALALRRSSGESAGGTGGGTGGGTAGGPGATVWTELVAGRLHPRPPELEGPAVDADAVDASAATTAAELLRRCDALLGRWETAPPVLTRSGGLPVRELRAAAKDLELPVDTVAVLAELLRAADLLATTPGSDVSIVPTEDVDDWRTLDNASRWARVAAGWLTLEALPGLATSVQPQRGQLVEDVDPAKPLPVFSWDLRRPGAGTARREILGVLAAAPVGTAVTGDSVRARLAWQGPRRNAVWWSVLVSWTLAEADLLGVTGRGALASAGRALLEGPTTPDGSDVATSAASKAAATVMDRHLPPPLDHVLVQADLTAVAPGPLEPMLAREMGLVADVESAGTATVFRFSESSLRRALDAGWSAADVRALLDRAARGTVPQSLFYLVDDVARRHGRLRVGMASCYVRCDDPALLAEVVAARKTGTVDLRPIAPTVAVSSAPLDRVLEVLRSAGYSPAGEGTDGVVRIEQTVAERVPVPVRRSTASATSGVPPEHLRTTVTRLRRAASAADAARSGAARTDVGGAITLPGQILTRLGEVVDDGGTVRMAYVNLEGRSTERVVHPLLLSGGYLTAYDEHSGERRTFAVSRISSLVVLATAS